MANSNGEFVAIDLKTCEKVWAMGTEKSMNSVDGVKFSFDPWDAQFGYLAVGDVTDEEYNGATVYKVMLVDGKALWQYSFKKGEVAALEVAEKQILIGVKKNFILLDSQAGDNLILAIDKETGKMLWKYKIKTNDANWSFVTDGFSKVYVPVSTIKLDINTGKTK